MTAATRSIVAAEAAIASKPPAVAAAAVAAAYDIVAREADRHVVRSPAVRARMLYAVLAITRLDSVRMVTGGLPEIGGRAAVLLERATRDTLTATVALDRATRRAA